MAATMARTAVPSLNAPQAPLKASGVHALRAAAPCVGGVRSGRTAARVVAASSKDVRIDKKFGKGKTGFRYDPSMQRWVRDNRVDLDFDDAEFDPMVRPKTGSAYVLWPIMHSELMDYNLKSITPDEVMKLQKKGAVLVDVREEPQYNGVHAAGAKSCPLFVPVQGRALYDNLKRLAMAAFAMQATERNRNFAEDLKKIADPKKTVIFMCATGGTLETQITRVSGGDDRTGNTGRVKKKVYNDPDRNFGKESRSLKACYEALQAGYKNVIHVDGGLNQWRYDDYPVEEL